MWLEFVRARNYKRSGITCKIIPLWKSIEFACLWSAVWLTRQQQQQQQQNKYFSLPDHQLPNN